MKFEKPYQLKRFSQFMETLESDRSLDLIKLDGIISASDLIIAVEYVKCKFSMDLIPVEGISTYETQNGDSGVGLIYEQKSGKYRFNIQHHKFHSIDIWSSLGDDVSTYRYKFIAPPSFALPKIESFLKNPNESFKSIKISTSKLRESIREVLVDCNFKTSKVLNSELVKSNFYSEIHAKPIVENVKNDLVKLGLQPISL